MKNIVITGGSSGVGLAIAKDLAAHHRVIIIGRRREKLARAQSQLGEHVSYLATDLSTTTGRTETIRFIADKFSHVDVLIHSAGVYPQTAAENIAHNLLPHYYLTTGLFDLLHNSRVLIVTGNPAAIKMAPLCNLQANSMMRAAWAVTHKTLLVSLFKEKLWQVGSTVNAFFPGDVQSDLMPYTQGLANQQVPVGEKLALDARYQDVTGRFFDETGQEVVLDPNKYNERQAKKLLAEYIPALSESES
ncbi:SDR family NAD(P)-dependent oxidoreductase [Leuconostocaceae bacterium ESL0958]|nr:SDR family NAD(P)-dependent oxidoreductase [Leuconostocaceae bacterium ESL0958]